MLIDDDNDPLEVLETMDLTKLTLDVEPKFLTRELVIKFHAADDLTFNQIAGAADHLAQVFAEAVKQLKAINP